MKKTKKEPKRTKKYFPRISLFYVPVFLTSLFVMWPRLPNVSVVETWPSSFFSDTTF